MFTWSRPRWDLAAWSESMIGAHAIASPLAAAFHFPTPRPTEILRCLVDERFTRRSSSTLAGLETELENSGLKK